MLNGLAHAHSGLRWVALILLMYALFNAFSKRQEGEYLKKDKMINLFTMISLHTQLLLGLMLYFFLSQKVQFSEGWMKNPSLRFYGMEHFVGMVAAIVIVTIGRKKGEKAVGPNKHKLIFKYYLIALILILAFIPWPFRAVLGGQWF